MACPLPTPPRDEAVAAMSKGTTYKRCSCRDTTTGKALGQACPKLRRPSGGWNPSHGIWQYQIDLPARADGSRRILRRGGFATGTDAETALQRIRDALAAADTDPATLARAADMVEAAFQKKEAIPTPDQVRRYLKLDVSPDGIPTVGAWLTEWLAGRKSVKKNTLRAYEIHIRLYLIPVLGDIRLDRLRRIHVQEVFTAIDERNDRVVALRASRDPRNRETVKGLKTVGAASMHRIRATLRAALNAAIRDGLTTDNPAKHVELPAAKRPKALVWTSERVHQYDRTGIVPSPVMVWTPEHTGAFLDHAEAADDRLYPLYHLVAMTGLRRGEACGLHWADVDLDRKTITVRWQITQLGWATELEHPKTDASEDHVSLDADTVEVLRQHRIRQWRERTTAGDKWAETGLVFTTPTGGQLHPADVTDHFKFLGWQAGLPPIRLHDLRHGAAALGLAAGVDMKTISERLRHSSITVTADVYGSILPELAQAAADKTAAIVPRRNRQSAAV